MRIQAISWWVLEFHLDYCAFSFSLFVSICFCPSVEGTNKNCKKNVGIGTCCCKGLRKNGAAVAHSEGHQARLEPAVGMMRNNQGHFNARGKEGVTRSCWQPPGNCRRKLWDPGRDQRLRAGRPAAQPCPDKGRLNLAKRDVKGMFNTVVQEHGIFCGWNNAELMCICGKYH